MEISSEGKIHGLFIKVEKEKLGKALAQIESKFSRDNIKLFLTPRNGNSESVSKFLDESTDGSDTFIDIDEGVANYGEIQQLGFGHSNQIPWNSLRELSE
jgi:Icc-related predicted phosphoesterase